MGRSKNVNGKVVQFTSKEELDRDDEERRERSKTRPVVVDPVIEALEMLVEELPKGRRERIADKVAMAKAARGV